MRPRRARCTGQLGGRVPLADQVDQRLGPRPCQPLVVIPTVEHQINSLSAAFPCPVGGDPHSEAGSGDYNIPTAGKGEFKGMIDNWPVSSSNIINYIKDIAGLSNLTVPAGYSLSISLRNDAEANITGVVFEVVDEAGKLLGKQEISLLSIPGVTTADLAPIVAFELNLVGPINSEIAVLSSGAGTIWHTASNALTALTEEPACTESGLVTAEAANTLYTLPPDSPGATLTQNFNMSSTMGMAMIRTQGKIRPSTRVFRATPA
jgi:hypothetical protein